MDQYWSPSWSPAWRARRAFSPREAWKIEIDLDSEMVDGQVEEEGALAGLLDGLGAELTFALGGGVRLGRQQQLVHVGSFAPAIRAPAELGAVGSLALAKQQVVRLSLDPLAGLEAEGLGAGSPPAARRLSPALASLDVVTGGVFGRAAVDVLPDVLQVVALTQRRDNRH
jgi:hypothetical protein